MIALRAVIQDIYGSPSVESSKFVKSLPNGVREIFIDAIKASPNYFPQLHHKNMKSYPFMDNVGLDLVLVEDYIARSNEFPNLIAKNKVDELPGLPFRILEINAGSPSGASNNMNVLQGLYEQAPEILDSLGRVMPNDHFKILGETYKSLGEAWTKNKKGVQISHSNLHAIVSYLIEFMGIDSTIIEYIISPIDHALGFVRCCSVLEAGGTLPSNQV